MQPEVPERVLTPAAVAAIFRVDVKTVSRWAVAGKIESTRTPGGHRRFLRSDVLALMSGSHNQNLPSVHAVADPDVRQSVPIQPQATDVRSTSTHAAAAAAVVADAVATALEAEAEVAAHEAIVTAEAVAAAATRAADAAARARGARAVAAAQAARVVADEAARTATALQTRAEAAAALIAESTARAVEEIAEHDIYGNNEDAKLIALRLTAIVEAVADATAKDAVWAAASAANAVAAAAEQMAMAVSEVDRGYEKEATSAADSLHRLNLVTARRVADETRAKAAGRAMVASEAAAAMSATRS